MNITKQIPNLFTLCNLSCGTIAIINLFNDEAERAVYLILLAAIFDFFDGFLARLFKVSGELGKQLDSLADLVTFGVAPACILYVMAEDLEGIARYAFILPVVMSAFRLAKFNLDTRQSHSFIGVPTPINGISAASWVFVDNQIKENLFGNPIYFSIYCVILAYLMVSEIPMPALKFKKAPLKAYYQHIFLLICGLIAWWFSGWFCVNVFFAVYVLSSILINFAPKKIS